MARFEVVFETSLYYAVTIEADDEQEATEKAIESRFPPRFSVPTGFEVADEEQDWTVEGVMPVRYDN